MQHVVRSIDSGDLHVSVMNRDSWKTLKKSINDIATFMEIFPFSQQLYLWSLAMYHTTLLDVQEEGLSLL